MARDGHVAKIPAGMTFEETSTLGVGITSVGQTLYMTLELPLPGEKPLGPSPFILIYGGSTSTGTLAIQYAKLYEPISILALHPPSTNNIADPDSLLSLLQVHATLSL